MPAGESGLEARQAAKVGLLLAGREAAKTAPVKDSQTQLTRSTAQLRCAFVESHHLSQTMLNANTFLVAKTQMRQTHDML
jgi:hypothetical protein